MKSKINYIEITIPNYFTTDSRWNDFESKKKIVRCIRKGLSKIDQSYVDNYDFKNVGENNIILVSDLFNFRSINLDQLIYFFIIYSI